VIADLQNFLALGVAEFSGEFEQRYRLGCSRQEQMHRNAAAGCVLAGGKCLHRSVLEDIY
jgi:hypothetical protein